MRETSGLPSAAQISWLSFSEKFYKPFMTRPARWALRPMLLTPLLLLLVVCAVDGFAQSDLGRISGFVKDPSGAMVPSAKVTVQNNSGVVRQATTNESGYYTITNVPPGLYTMTTEAPGFRRYQSKDNKLNPSSDLVIDATLTVGSVTESIQVAATATPLQTESASVQS